MLNIKSLSLPALALATLLSYAASGLGALVQGPSSLGQWQEDTTVQSNSQSGATATINYVVHLYGKDEGQLDSKVKEIYDRGTTTWLKYEQLKAYVEPNKEAKDALVAALSGPDTQISFSKLGDTAYVTSTVERTSKLFNADFKNYRGRTQDDGPEVTRWRTRQYTVPAQIEKYVRSIGGFVDFPTFEYPPLSKWSKQAHSKRDDGNANATANPCDPPGFMVPDCLKKLYDFSPEPPKSTAPALGIVLFDPAAFLEDDFKLFAQQYNPALKDYKIDVIYGPNATGGKESPGTGELTLDSQVSASLVYPTPTKVYILHGIEDYFLDFFTYFIEMPDEERPAVLSMSFSGPEEVFGPKTGETMCHYAKILTLMGVTIVVSSGDRGVNQADAEKCPPFTPSYPSGCEYILSVGGTRGFTDERAVDEAVNGYSSGSGFSNMFKTPEFQQSSVAAYLEQLGDKEKGNFSPQGRGFPDVAAQGANIPVIFFGDLYSVGGTSASAPIVASILTRTNSLLAEAGDHTLGWAHPLVYNQKYRDMLRDVLVGKSGHCNDTSGKEHGFPVARGWDPVTGLGSLNQTRLGEVALEAAAKK